MHPISTPLLTRTESAAGASDHAHRPARHMTTASQVARRLHAGRVLPALLTALLFGATADAQDRTGLVVGAAVGAGVLRSAACVNTTCESASAYARLSLPNLKIGAMLTPTTALVVYAPGGISSRGGVERSIEAIMPAVQHWLTDRVWVLGGVGLGLDAPPFWSAPPRVFHAGSAASAGVGFDLLVRGRRTVDVQARALGGRISMGGGTKQSVVAVDVLLGINWY